MSTPNTHRCIKCKVDYYEMVKGGGVSCTICGFDCVEIPTPSSIARDAAKKCLSYLRLDGTWDAAILKGDKKQVTTIIQSAIDAGIAAKEDSLLEGDKELRDEKQ